jgi:hypothetical protein
MGMKENGQQLGKDDPFYSSQIRFPTTDSSIPPSIANDHHFHWFDQCISAVDGTHIHA